MVVSIHSLNIALGQGAIYITNNQFVSALVKVDFVAQLGEVDLSLVTNCVSYDILPWV